MQKPDLFFIITKNCNYTCKHCYIEASPRQQESTIGVKEFRSVINHLPKISLEITLTGGEVFTIKDILFSYFDYINYVNRARKKRNQKPITIGVQTNGFWAVSDNVINDTLSELKRHNIIGLDITSYDKYHRDEGIDYKRLERLAKLAEESKFFKWVELRGSIRKAITPMGRARKMNLRPSEMNLTAQYCKRALNNYFVQFREDGSVYACCLFKVKLSGNVIEEPLIDIVRRARKNRRLKMLNDGGIAALAQNDGWTKKDIKTLIKKQGTCGACRRIYGANEMLL